MDEIQMQTNIEGISGNEKRVRGIDKRKICIVQIPFVPLLVASFVGKIDEES